MNLEAISGASTIALISALVFLTVAQLWQGLSRGLVGGSSFPDSIMREPAQRFRDRLEQLTRRQSVYLASAVVFSVIFATAYVLDPQQLFAGLAAWQSISVLTAVLLATGYGVYRFVHVVVEKNHIAFIRDASMATGHGLQKLSASDYRLFHDVPCAAGTIDNVIVGPQGIYAICVIARRPGRDNRVRLGGDKLAFAPRNRIVSVARCGQKSAQLAREIRKHIKHDVRVRPVIAVPGWEIDSQSSDEYLVVNERNLAMLRGWKDPKDYLMNEDVQIVHDLLTRRCTRFRR